MIDTPENNTPQTAGWMPRLIRFLFPSMTLTRKESLNAICSLQRKLNETRSALKESRCDAKRWRERALSAERIIAHGFPQALKESVEDHDKKFETSLLWRL